MSDQRPAAAPPPPPPGAQPPAPGTTAPTAGATTAPPASASGPTVESLTGTRVSDLGEALAGITDVHLVNDARKADTRSTAREVYDARLADLQESEGRAEGGITAKTRVRVKYRGETFAPGATISFAREDAALVDHLEKSEALENVRR